jgi:hypothetical protein
MNDMGDPSDDPRRQFLELLSSGTSVVWYSENGRERPILDYTLRLLGTTIDAIGITPHGFAVLPDSSVVLVRLRGPRGGAVTVTPISQAGLSRVNSALSVEHEETYAALSTGSYTGNEANASQGWIAGLSVHPDWEGSPVLEFIDGASIIHATGIGTSPPIALA